MDSFDYLRLRRYVLQPLGPAGSRQYRPRAHDLSTDSHIHEPPRAAAPRSIVLIDGLFLHRDELNSHRDFSVFLDVPFEVTARRMAKRDGSSADPAHPSMGRYIQAQRLYFGACDPRSRTSIIIDNTDR
jgi:uridine kinase